MINRIKNSLMLSKETYTSDYVGNHWSAYFSPKIFSSFLDYRNFNNFRKVNSLSIGLDDHGNYFQTIEIFINLLKKYSIKIVAPILEADCGNPPSIKVSGYKLNYNDIFIANFALTINSLFKKVKAKPALIVEIGSGHGALANKLKKLFIDSKIILIDLAEAGALATYYINETHPNSKILTYSDYCEMLKLNSSLTLANIDFDFAILPPKCMHLIDTASVDLYVNTRSMMEMKNAAIHQYFFQINRTIKIGGIFYNVNRYCKFTSGDDVILRDYPYDGFWSVLRSQKSFMQPHIHEIITRRTKSFDASIGDALLNLQDSKFILGERLSSDKRSIRFNRMLINAMFQPFYFILKSRIGKKMILKLFLKSTA
jgi:putative sugar O-methyltransferase